LLCHAIVNLIVAPGQNALYLANRDHRNDIVNFLRNDKEILKIRNAFDDEKKTSDHDELNPS